MTKPDERFRSFYKSLSGKLYGAEPQGRRPLQRIQLRLPQHCESCREQIVPRDDQVKSVIRENSPPRTGTISLGGGAGAKVTQAARAGSC
jgi:hypothetical protein